MIIMNHQAPNLQTEQHDSVVIKQEPPELDSTDTEQGRANKNTSLRIFYSRKTLILKVNAHLYYFLLILLVF